MFDSTSCPTPSLVNVSYGYFDYYSLGECESGKILKTETGPDIQTLVDSHYDTLAIQKIAIMITIVNLDLFVTKDLSDNRMFQDALETLTLWEIPMKISVSNLPRAIHWS